MAKFYAIVGTFFQQTEALAVVHSPSQPDGAVAVMPIDVDAVFTGHFGMDNEGAVTGDGDMIDAFGHSAIVVEKLAKSEFRFLKIYQHNGHRILYQFKATESGIWEGTWESVAAGTGIAKCRLLNMSEDHWFRTVGT